MRHLLVILFCTLYSVATSGQSNLNSGLTCSEVLKSVTTAEWKNDSLGIIGYRYKYLKLLRESIPDSVSKMFLFEKLGKPSIVRKTAFGKPWRNHVEYVYYILNVDPTGKLIPYEGLYIAFIFDENETLLEQIIDGDFCG